MESTPGPITGYTRAWPSRIPVPLQVLTAGLRRVARARRLEIGVSRPDPEEAIVQVRGPLGVRGAARLKQAIASCVSEGVGRLTIDLSEASRVGPAGVAALVEATQCAAGREVRLTRLPMELRFLVEKAGLHRVLEIVE